MAEYIVDRTKFILLLLLVSLLFLSIGFYAAKATAPNSSRNTNNIADAQVLRQSVQSLLEDKTITDPRENYTAFQTGMLISHTISGRVTNVTQRDFRIISNQISVTVPKTTLTTYFLVSNESNSTRSPTTSLMLKIGDLVSVIFLTEPVTGRLESRMVDIRS